MKERPILFQGPMVSAIRADNKTQTRRLVNLPPEYRHGFWHWKGKPIVDFTHIPCPYGQPGDRLWVKETCFPVHKWKHAPLFAAVEPDWLYRADYLNRRGRPSIIGCHHWTPSILMPRVASRLTLEVVAVRIERLRSISVADAWAEGVELDGEGICWVRDSNPHIESTDPIVTYAVLWDSINAAPSPVKGSDGKVSHYVSYPWAGDELGETRRHRGKRWYVYPNPWVWVVEFRRGIS